ncbi:PstS family phosphate ABC transporter substrate-binding protein [Holophaga foetida]|uniref:PstS family phosphate ABC transporter substrate-binding protein n=1 Tax=Holophaga foetida TaxID=35839 RepID=UPI0002474612|nr:substrate-binding domain-containing protein [Holophaga foetida]
MRSMSLSLALTAGLLGVFSGSHPLMAQQATQESGELSVVVAELVEPLFLNWRNAYQQNHPLFRVNHRSTMNSVTVKAFIEGQTPIAPCAKEMSEAEVAAFTAKWGYPPTRIAVAMDALVALVNKNNPIKEIKIEQLDAIFSTTRLQGWPKDVETWGDLGLTSGNWASRPIERWGHPEGSGTRNFFKEVVELGGRGKSDTKRGSDIMAMIESLMANQAAIGYGSISQTYSELKAIPLISKGGKNAVEASQTAVADGSYPLGRVLYFYINKPTRKPLDPAIKSFMTFVLSREGQRLVPASGFVSIPENLASMGLRRLEN